MDFAEEIASIEQNFNDISFSLMMFIKAGNRAIEDATNKRNDVLRKLESFATLPDDAKLKLEINRNSEDAASFTILAEGENNKLTVFREGTNYDATNLNDDVNIQAKGNSFSLSPKDIILMQTILKEYNRSLTSQPEILFSMSFIYLIAVFDAFIVDILTAVLKKKPEILKGVNEKLTYKEVIELNLSGDLINKLVEKEINRFGYESIKEQVKYIKDRLGIDIEDSGATVDELAEIREIRNILVHNSGSVNTIFLNNVNNSSYKLRDKIQITPEVWEQAKDKLSKVVDYLYEEIKTKF